MHGDTQANRLRELMQKKGYLHRYEIALPFMKMKSDALKALKSNEVFILGLKTLECIILDNDILCAKVILIKERERYSLKVIDIVKESIPLLKHKKYELIKFSLGTFNLKSLVLGQSISIKQSDFEAIDLVYQSENMARVSLLSIEGKLAVKIKKVNKHANTTDA